VIGLREHVEHRAAQRRITIEQAVQLIGRKDVRQLLGAHPVVDAHEGVVGRREGDAFRRQLARQPAVAIAIELQAERGPGRHSQIDQPEIGIHEVEIVVQALAAVRAQIGLVRPLVVPRLVGVAGFHRRNDMDQAGMVAALFQHFRDHRFLADMTLGDVLDRDRGFLRQRRRALPHAIAQRRGKLRVIENPNLVGVKKPRHPLRVARPRKRSRHHHPVITGQNTRNPLLVALRQRRHHTAPRHQLHRRPILHQPLWFRLRRLR